MGSYLSHPPNDVIKVQQKSFLLLILILPLFTPQKTNNKSHVSTTFVTMFCQRQYFNEDIEIGRLLKESLADSNASQLVFEGKREKYIFSENVLPTRRKRNLSSIKFCHVCKDRENPFFVVELQVKKHLDRATAFEINLISFESRPYKFST